MDQIVFSLPVITAVLFYSCAAMSIVVAENMPWFRPVAFGLMLSHLMFVFTEEEHQRRISFLTEASLTTCADMAVEGQLKHQSQWDACAHFINKALEELDQ